MCSIIDVKIATTSLLLQNDEKMINENNNILSKAGYNTSKASPMNTNDSKVIISRLIAEYDFEMDRHLRTHYIHLIFVCLVFFRGGFVL
jgi:hypothetical protein